MTDRDLSAFTAALSRIIRAENGPKAGGEG